MAETVDDSFARANAEIAALKKTKPKSAAEARIRAVELSRLQQDLIEASKRVVDAAAAKRIAAKRIATNGNGNGAKPAAGEQPLTTADFPALAKGLVGWLGPILKDIETRLAALESKKGLAPLAARIAELEQKPGLKYQGVWAAEKVYSVGDFVTDHGSLWHCWDTNVGVRPGSSETWQLAVQRGRDAKSKGRQ